MFATGLPVPLVSTVPWQRVAIGAGAGMFLGMALGRFAYSSMIPALIEAGHLDTIAAGYIGGANLVGFLAGAAASTSLAHLLRIDRILFVAVIVAVVALWGSALPWGMVWLGLCRAAVGVAAGCIMVLGLATTAQTAPPEHRARAMSSIFVGVGSGIFFGAAIVPASLEFGIAVAWMAVALAGLLAALVALYCWWDTVPDMPAGSGLIKRSMRQRRMWYAIIAASFLFSFGIVPHTIYWFDYLARELQLGYSIAGWHWKGVGLCAILGPIAAARLAIAYGTRAAIAVTYLVMAIGVGVPFLAQSMPLLVASTIIFGAQPAVSTLLGARARDLGDAGDMPSMMRTIILANGFGSALAGVTVPALLDKTASYELLFLTGGAALFLGGLLCMFVSDDSTSD